MNIVLMYGGRSGEHEISLLSCAAVARNINPRHTVTLISVSKDGKWYLEDENVLTKLRADKNAALSIHAVEKQRVSLVPGGGREKTFFVDGYYIPCDVVFPVMHGTYSEDGTIQGMFEMAGIPYVGCGVLASAATMDKHITKILWQHAGLPVVPYICITRADVNDSSRYDALVEQAVKELGFPLFVKPCSAGSSDGASRAENEKELSVALLDAFQWDNKVLIEKAVSAREVECSVTGNSVTFSPDEPETVPNAYGPGEIVPTHTFYDYDAKYNDPDGAELKIPAALDAALLSRIREMAKKAYRAVDASGLSRVDFFIDRNTQELYLNEINTIPGFTSISMFPKLCDAEGLPFGELLELLFAEAKARFAARDRLRTSR
ncbi:MAG: D-alanine--D-alanine ligase [Treponema sp.]|nr:D-alanine--D-alanine ligase [Treponema sp.]